MVGELQIGDALLPLMEGIASRLYVGDGKHNTSTQVAMATHCVLCAGVGRDGGAQREPSEGPGPVPAGCQDLQAARAAAQCLGSPRGAFACQA